MGMFDFTCMAGFPSVFSFVPSTAAQRDTKSGEDLRSSGHCVCACVCVRARARKADCVRVGNNTSRASFMNRPYHALSEFFERRTLTSSRGLEFWFHGAL